MHCTRFAFIFWLATWLVACSPQVRNDVGGLGDAGTAPGDGGLNQRPRGYAVISSDYAVTTVSLLHADGTPWKPDFIDSGSASTGLVTALSGDVSLPTRSGDRGVLVLLDGLRTDVVTRIDLASGKILGQLKTQAPNAGRSTAYSSNPHDYAYVDATTAFISRYEPNPNPNAADLDRGNDLIRIDPTHFTRTSERIDFSPWNGQAERRNPDTGETEMVTVYARPSSIVRLGDYLVVGLDGLSLGFDAAGDGQVALVELKSRKVKVLPLPKLQNCGDVEPVPADDTHVAVACTGFFRGVPRQTAGLIMLVLRDGALEIENLWRANADAAAAMTTYAMLPLSTREVLAVAPGEVATTSRPETHDTLYRVDLITGEQTQVFEAQGRYVIIGKGTFEPESGLLLVPDASTDERNRPTAGVRRFMRRADGTFTELGITRIDPILPARSVRALP